MFTNVRTVFRERVCEWYYLWSQLHDFPTLSARGLEMTLQVPTTEFYLLIYPAQLLKAGLWTIRLSIFATKVAQAQKYNIQSIQYKIYTHTPV